jgi:hypothetical protein
LLKLEGPDSLYDWYRNRDIGQFSKKRVAEKVKSLLIEKKVDEGSAKALKMIIDRFAEKFPKT